MYIALRKLGSGGTPPSQDSPTSTIFSRCSYSSTPATSRSPTPNSDDNFDSDDCDVSDTVLPQYLPRPKHIKPVELGTLCLDNDLESSHVPIQYLLDQLRASGPQILNASTKAAIEIPTDTLEPEFVRVRPSPCSKIQPTHVLAVTGDDCPNKTLLLATFGLPYAIHSTRLPYLSKSSAETRRLSDGSLLLPVVPLHVPSILAFPTLHAFLLCPSADNLFKQLIPPYPSTSRQSISSLCEPSPCLISQTLAKSCPEAVRHRIGLNYGLWQNICALEIADRSLWQVLHLSWSILYEAADYQHL